MLENELNKLWQSSSAKEAIQVNSTSLIQELDVRVQGFDTLLKKRNAREYLVLGILAFLLIPGIIFIGSLITKIALLGLLCWCFTAAYKIYSIAHLPLPNAGLPAKEYLQAMRDKLVKERKLVNTTTFWYILPPLICEVVFLYGQGIKGQMLLATSIPLLLIAGLVFYINHTSVKKEFDPLLEQLDNTVLAFE